jgi:GNAT superfamily N-acetyltransferase
MITKASKCPTDVLERVSNFVYKNGDFAKENFSRCRNPIEVNKTLASSDSWYVLLANRPTALFKLEISEPIANISQICVNSDDSLEAVVSSLRRDLRNMRITSLTVRVPPNDMESLSVSGFEKRVSYVKFSRVPAESKMMPILPLVNATQKELPILSRLMYDSYAKADHVFSDIQSAEKSLRSIMSGVKGQYLSDASFASGAFQNLVSACLLTVDSPGQAKIAQLFTHPLYRARGLATTEIAVAMNRLVASGIGNLIVWNRESDDVVRRLLTKMGFKGDSRVFEIVAGI